MSAEVAVIGSFVQDLAFKVDSFPTPGETRIGRFITGPGGKGSNQAVACHRQGVKTIFIGAVGADIFGDGYKEWSAAERLPVSLLTVAGEPTGAASIVVNSRAENQIVVALGANSGLTARHVLDSLRRQTGLRLALLQTESNLDAAAAALAEAGSRGIFSILNPAPINPDVTVALISQADLITPNETEFLFLFRLLTETNCSEDPAGLSDADLAGICGQIPARAILITLGSAGSALYRGASREIVRIPALQVRPIDTTGAGDAFNGGLAAGFVKFDGDLLRAIRFATVVAGLSTEKEGTAPAMPGRSEVEKHSSFYRE